MSLNQNVKVTLDGDGSRLDRVLNKGAQSVGNFAKSARDKLNSNMGQAMAGYFSVSTIKSMTMGVLETADQLGDMSNELGIASRDLYALRKAGIDAGVEIENIAKMFRLVAEAKDKAMKGDVEKGQLFGQLGLTTDRLAGMNKMQITEAVGQAVQGLDVESRNQFVGNLFGEGAAKVFDRMPEVFADFEGFKDKLGKLLPSQEDLDTLGNQADQLEELKQTIEAGLIPVLAKLIGVILEWKNALVGKVEKNASGFYAAIEADKTYDPKTSGGLSRREWNQKAFETAYNQADVELQKERDELDALLAYKRKTRPDLQLLKQNVPKVEAVKEDKTKELSVPLLNKGDSLTSIGNFLGGNVDTLQRLSEEANQLLRQIADSTTKLANKTNNNSGIIG